MARNTGWNQSREGNSAMTQHPLNDAH